MECKERSGGQDGPRRGQEVCSHCFRVRVRARAVMDVVVSCSPSRERTAPGRHKNGGSVLPPATPGGGRSDAVKKLEAMIACEAEAIVGKEQAKRQSRSAPGDAPLQECREEDDRRLHSRLSNSVDSLGPR